MSFCSDCYKSNCDNCLYSRDGWRELEAICKEQSISITDLAGGNCTLVCPICGYLVYPNTEDNNWDCCHCDTRWTAVELVESIIGKEVDNGRAN